MNGTQIQTTLAPLIAFFAGLLAGKGVFGLDAATWAQVIGGAAGFAATIWGIIATRKTAMVSTVAAMPEVTKVELDKTAPGTTALDNATPANVVVK